MTRGSRRAMNVAIGWAILAGGALLPGAATAQARESGYPGIAPIEITVLAPAGSSPDLTARVFADALARQLGVVVTIANRPGAGGAIGYRHVAAQKRDGRALVWMSGSIATAHHLGLLEHDYRAFEAVACVLVESPLVAVRSDSPWRTLGELIADAAARPSDITVANSGRGSDTQFSSLALFRVAKVEITEVPLPRSHVVSLLLGGHVDAVVDLPAGLSHPVRNGTLRLLASLGPRRDPARPDIPTARELGYPVSFPAWRGVGAPRGTAVEVIAVLEAAIRSAVRDPEFGRAIERLGVHRAFMPSVAFTNLIERDHEELGGLMQRIGMGFAGRLR